MVAYGTRIFPFSLLLHNYFGLTLFSYYPFPATYPLFLHATHTFMPLGHFIVPLYIKVHVLSLQNGSFSVIPSPLKVLKPETQDSHSILLFYFAPLQSDTILHINIHLLYLAITTNLDELQGASKIIGRFYS